MEGPANVSRLLFTNVTCAAALTSTLESERLAAFPGKRIHTGSTCEEHAGVMHFLNQQLSTKSHIAMQNPANKQEVFADDALVALTGERRFKAFGFMKLFSKHILEAA